MRLKCVNSVAVSGRIVYQEGEIYHGARNENGSIEIISSVGTGVWSEYEPAFLEHFTILPEIEDESNKGESSLGESTVTKESTTAVPKPEPPVVHLEQSKKKKKKENKVISLFKRLL